MKIRHKIIIFTSEKYANIFSLPSSFALPRRFVAGSDAFAN